MCGALGDCKFSFQFRRSSYSHRYRNVSKQLFWNEQAALDPNSQRLPKRDLGSLISFWHMLYRDIAYGGYKGLA